ncbi:MAG: ABC transporter permease [Anaerolineales bacterium]|uniref:ABC transporter permease n=1 Tax=Candidatus Villigracilis affinis TaxID=3140682 RepID=UPI001DB63C8A|nr:ABC transporter permease [Anaerolineales bacterium]MBK9602209.1 ABC transporter permease [Anaerolineales bacterium]MBL0345686.1 ABC transporter permease [Anaerolineales bacterium]
MNRYQILLRKIGWALFTILFVIILNFFLFRILPGDPARAGVRDPRLKKESIEILRVRFGLDKPIINCFESLNPIKVGSCDVNPLDTQFFIYVRNLLQGELGFSYHTNRPVGELLSERLWNTVLLIGAGQILAIIIGVIFGIVAAWKARTSIDRVAVISSLVAWSLPTFWLGIILLFWGSQNGFPLAGKTTPGMSSMPLLQQWGDLAVHMFLPTLTYTIIYMAEYTLIMRSSLMDVLSEDYILTAKAKGLSNFQILKDHALKNAMLPLVTVIAINLGFTVAGVVQIETVFSWPGLGSAIFEAVNRRDFPVLQGAFLLIAVAVIFANFLADLTYTYLDPRVQTE